MQPKVLSVSEVAYWVDDVERAMEWYVNTLGFEVESHDPGHNAFLKSGDFLLVLFDRRSPNTKLANEYLEKNGAPRGDVYHIAFRVRAEDFESAFESVSARENGVRGPITFDTGRRSFFLEDLDDHTIEVTDR